MCSEPACAGAASATALEAVRPPIEGFKMRALPRAAARLRAETLEAAEARLTFGVNLAVIASLALLLIAKNLVRGVELSKARSRLGIVLVGVGVQLFGELAEGALYLRFICTLRYPQNFVGVAHS